MGVGLPMPAAADSVKLVGCLVKGEGDGYMLENSPLEPTPTSAGRTVEPGALGTSGSFANVFYWLEGDNDLKRHVGHTIAVEGDTKGDVKQGEMSIDRKYSWTELDVKSGGRHLKAEVPNASVVPGPEPDKKINILVRRVDVEKVKMLDAGCR
jgi:hypothetical protein